jgi:hypothetical protein
LFRSAFQVKALILGSPALARTGVLPPGASLDDPEDRAALFAAWPRHALAARSADDANAFKARQAASRCGGFGGGLFTRRGGETVVALVPTGYVFVTPLLPALFSSLTQRGLVHEARYVGGGKLRHARG